MGRTGKGKGGGCAGGSKTDSQPEIPLYSREDIREQYCINKKELDGLERSSHLRRAKGFFGCLTSRKVHFIFLITIIPVKHSFTSKASRIFKTNTFTKHSRKDYVGLQLCATGTHPFR